MRIHLVGAAGPLGSLIAYHLRRVLPVSDTVTTIRRNSRQMREFYSVHNASITVARKGVRHTASGFTAEIPNTSHSTCEETRTIPEDHIDSLIVTSRTYSTIPMLNMLSSRLTSSSTVVLLQNGMGMYDDLLKFTFPDPSYRPHFVLATHSHSLYGNGQFNVVHNRIGEIKFAVIPNSTKVDVDAGFYQAGVSPFERKGRLSDLVPTSRFESSSFQSLHDTVQTLLKLEELNASWVSMSDMQTALRKRLVIQSVVDPLTTLMNCPNGQIFLSPQGVHICERICHEASHAFKAELDARMKNMTDTNHASYSHTMPQELLPDELHRAVTQYVSETKNFISPMLADLRSGRPTEIRYLNGHFIRLGAIYDVFVGRNMMLHNLIKLRSAIPLDQAL
ncbi:ketopantoate reductase PanE/ApbA C terminal-domain-containing protein [Mucidula mucida]|nr:ketopantoate reductase PanE/ApbA C terminal-domain-containing protein [Mucidula mucida]